MTSANFRHAVLTFALVIGYATTAHVAPDFCGSANNSPSNSNASNTPFYLRWDTPQITAAVTIAPETRTRSEDSVQKLMSKATDLWRERIGSTVSVNWKESPNAMIKVLVLPKEKFPAGIKGTTTTYYGMFSHAIRRVEIRINGDQVDDMLLLTAVHEFGHALGVQGHSTLPGDVMSENPGLPVQITPHDAEIAQQAYYPRSSEQVTARSVAESVGVGRH